MGGSILIIMVDILADLPAWFHRCDFQSARTRAAVLPRERECRVPMWTVPGKALALYSEVYAPNIPMTAPTGCHRRHEGEDITFVRLAWALQIFILGFVKSIASKEGRVDYAAHVWNVRYCAVRCSRRM